MRSATYVLLILLATWLTGCVRDRTPALIEVTDISPHEVEVGDKLEVRGSGFPQGRPAHVTLRGLVFQPGRASRRLEVEADGIVTAPDRVELAFTAGLEAKLCGRGLSAAHATFRGEVEVAFASTVRGAPPLAGTAHGIELDARPPARAEVEAEREREGRRVLAFLGVTAGAVSARGIEVTEVKAGSPADAAGIVATDAITLMDGVRVGQVGDMAGTGSRFVELGVRRGDGGAEDIRTVSMIGFEQGRVPYEMLPALAIIVLALAAVWILLRRAPTKLDRVERVLGWKARGVSLADIARAQVGRGPAAIGAAVAVSALLGTFALGPHVIGRELDLPVLSFVAVALVVTARVLSARGHGSLRHGAVGFVAMLVYLIALALVVGAAGAISLSELVRSQGAAPWEWNASRSPALALLAFAAGSSVVAAMRLTPKRALAALTHDRAPEGVSHALERFGVWVASAVLVAVFLGGWRLPTTDSAALGPQLAGGACFVAKIWVVAGALRLARAGLAPLEARPLLRLTLLKLLPLAMASGAAGIALRRFGTSILYEGPAGAVVVSLVALVALRLAVRVQEAVRAVEPRRASPFV